MTHLNDIAFQPLPGPHPGSGQFLRGFVGSAVLLVAINASEPLFFGEGYFAELAYHPFWIVILLAAVQHGLFVGLSVVGLATMMMDWPSRPVGMDITEHYVDIATAPAQWLIAALLIGLYRQHQIRQERALGRENARLRDVNRTLAEEIRRLDAFVAWAELAAATRAAQPGEDKPDNRLAMLDRLAAADAEQRQQAFIDAARACVPGSVAWLKPDAAGMLAPAAVTDEGAALAGLSMADLPLAGAGEVLPLGHANGESPGLRPALCRLVASDGDPQGVLLAQSSELDEKEMEAALDALGRALEYSLRRTPDAASAGPLSPEPELAHA